MSRLKNIAKSISKSGNYISINDLVVKYPQGVEVNGLKTMATKFQPQAYIFTFKSEKTFLVDEKTGFVVTDEYGNNVEVGTGDTYYFFAETGDLKKIVSAWLKDMTLDEINAELQSEPITLKIDKVQMKNGNFYTKASIVDTESESESDA